MLKLRRYFDTTDGCDFAFQPDFKARGINFHRQRYNSAKASTNSMPRDGTGVPAWRTGNTRKLRLSTNVECRTYGVEMLQ
ncbi:MAG TPA: hypothetical protein VKC60_14025 [Opitutaceae bacterium]|nr:hypothetical protein [Opitutaceae bacterium]